MDRMNDEKLHQMTNAHLQELQRRKVDYSDKMEADQVRYSELEDLKRLDSE